MKPYARNENYAFLSGCTITTTTTKTAASSSSSAHSRGRKIIDFFPINDTFLHVSEQVAVVSIVSAVFVLVDVGRVKAREVLFWSVLSAMVGMVCTKVDDADEDDDDEKEKKPTKKKLRSSENHRRDHFVTALKRRIRLGVGVTLAVAISSPLFLTMTASVSDDTAVAVSGILAFVHLATHDYRAESTSLGNALEGVSLVSAIFSASLMASRLKTVLDAFACALLAVGAFTMSMPLRRQWRTREKSTSSFATTVSAHGIAAWMLEMIDSKLMIAYVITIGLFLTLAPLSFAFARRTLKMKIEGPWAEAKPELDLMRSSVRRAGVPIFRHILANAPSRGRGDR
ncbi:unnamed protein product [Bathycoccus prasinos]|jgi:hypothetical protein